MIDGLYLSAYLDYGPLKNVLDVRLRHDHGAALWQLQGGILTLRRYWEFERLSGIKQHQRALFDITATQELLTKLLSEEGTALDDIVAIWGTPGLETDQSYRRAFNPSYAFHGLAHLMTTIFYKAPDPSSTPIVAMSLDGGPDMLFEADARKKHYYPGCVIDEDGMRLFPCESPGRLWSYAKTKYKMREGTLMALASASSAEVHVDFRELERLSFLDNETRNSAPYVLETLDAATRDAVRKNSWKSPPADERLSTDEHRISAIMKVVSKLSLEIVTRNIQLAIDKYDADIVRSRFGIAGGFALNCPTNSTILDQQPFVDAQIPPCASDSGLALGVGLAAFFPLLKSGEVSVELTSPYFGQGVGNIDEELSRGSHLIESISYVSPSEVASILATDGVVAWIEGNAEMGPRALGHRSLLADPRSLAIRDRVNAIKQRQWWRPVAPIVLHDEAERYFLRYRSSPYMLLNFEGTDLARAQTPGILHVDGTARVQSITQELNTALYHLLGAFNKIAGCPILGNTSLNDSGEPIVNRLSEALHFAAGKGVRHLVLNSDTLITLKDVRVGYSGPSQRELRHYFDIPQQRDPALIANSENPHGLDRKELAHFFDNPDLFRGLDLRSAEAASTIRQETADYIARYPGALDRG